MLVQSLCADYMQKVGKIVSSFQLEATPPMFLCIELYVFLYILGEKIGGVCPMG